MQAAFIDISLLCYHRYVINHLNVFYRLEENEKLMAQQLKQQQQQQRRSPSLDPPPRLLSPIREMASPPQPVTSRVPSTTAAPLPSLLPDVSSPPRLERFAASFVCNSSFCYMCYDNHRLLQSMQSNQGLGLI